MKPQFFSNILFLLLINLLIKPFWIFGVDRTVQNTVGAADYGIYLSLFNFSFLFYMVLDFGLANYNSRKIAADPKLIDSYSTNILGAKSFLSLIYAAMIFIGAQLMAYDGLQKHLLYVLAFNQILVSFILYFRSNISALHHFKLDGLLSVLDRLLMIIIIGYLLWFHNDPLFKIEWFVYGQTAAYIIAVLVAAFASFKFASLSFKFSFSTIKKILKASFPHAMLFLLMSIYNRVDAVMIEKMLPTNGDEQTGIYGASYRILDAFNMIGFLFSTLLLPMFARQLGKNLSIKPLTVLSFRAIYAIAVIVGMSCLFFSEPIMNWLYFEANSYYAKIFGLLIMSFIPVSCLYVLGTLLTANGSLKSINIIAGLGVFLNVGLNLWLIPKQLAYGATIATVITQVMVLLFHAIIVQRIFKFTFNFRSIFTFLLLPIAMLFIHYASRSLNIDWKFLFLIHVILGSLMALILKLIDSEDLLYELRKPA